MNTATRKAQEILEVAGYVVMWWLPGSATKTCPIPGQQYPHSTDPEVPWEQIDGPFFCIAETNAEDYLNQVEKYYGADRKYEQHKISKWPEARFFRVTAE